MVQGATLKQYQFPGSTWVPKTRYSIKTITGQLFGSSSIQSNNKQLCLYHIQVLNKLNDNLEIQAKLEGKN